jgi:hypothetical protein
MCILLTYSVALVRKRTIPTDICASPPLFNAGFTLWGIQGPSKFRGPRQENNQIMTLIFSLISYNN